MRTPGIILILLGLGMMLMAVMMGGTGHYSEQAVRSVKNAAVRLERLSDQEIARLWPEYSVPLASEKTKYIRTRLGVEWVRGVPGAIMFVMLTLFGCGVLVLLLGIWVVVAAKPARVNIETAT